jgi:hypothetical protein
MQWQWTDGEKIFRALRAVDTATHPDHQGKGIFKKLTLQLIHSSEGWADFIFNTPNEKSKPGYIKMGWEEAGRLPLNFKAINPLASAIRLLTGKAQRPAKENGNINEILDHAGLDDLLACPVAEKGKIHTVYSREYLRWRYLDVPVATYSGCALEHDNMLKGFFIYRIKSSRLGRELRITDIFAASSKDASALMPLLKDRARHHRIDYVTVSGLNNSLSVFPASSLAALLKGPIVTVRKVKSGIDNLKTFKHWHPSLGDLELF